MASSGRGQVFTTTVKVRFADCDPAGIVFYPRYFEMFNNLVEDWCHQALGLSFRELHLGCDWGLPTVHVETDFVAPSEIGDILSAELRVSKIGSASMMLQVCLNDQRGEPRVKGKLVLVLMDLKLRKAIPIPEEIKARIQRFCE